MISVSLQSIPICDLAIGKEEMSISRVNRHRHGVTVENSPLMNKRNLRQPLKCRKNTIDVNRSIKRSKSAKIGTQQIHSTDKSPISLEIDDLSTISPPKSPKRILRSSLTKMTLDPNAITVADKVSPKYKHKKQQSVGEKTRKSPISVKTDMLSGISKTVPSKSSKRVLRSSLPKMTLDFNEIAVGDKVSPKYKQKKQQNIPDEETRKSPISLEIDDLSMVDLPKSRKRILRSSLQKMTLDFNEIAVADKVSPKYKRKKQDNISDKKARESHISVEIDVLSEMCKTLLPSKSPKRILRSSLPKMTLDSNETAVSDKASPKYKRKKQQNILDEKLFVCKTPSKSPNKSKTSSFVRKKLIAECNIKSPEKNESSHNISIGRCELSQMLQNKMAKSTRRSMALRSSQEFSEHEPIPVASGSKDLKNSEAKARKHKVKDNKQQIMQCSRRSSKNLSSPQKQKIKPTVKRKYVRKSPMKSKTPVRSISFSGVPIDDLGISPLTLKRNAKSEGFKLPCKKSLKRKRFIIDSLKKADEEYEDDIYEEKEFNIFTKIFPDSSESEVSSFSSSTPKLGFNLTPLVRGKTPVYKDCFSPTEYALSRKVAEECIYRNNKRKSKPSKKTPAVPEKKKLEFNEVLEEACKIQKEVEKLTVDESSDSEDIYFSDCEN